MKLTTRLLLPVLLCYCFITNAQVSTNFNNNIPITDKGKFNKTYQSKIDLELSSLDINKLLEKESAGKSPSDGIKTLQIAEAVPVDIDVAGKMNWSEEDGFAFGKYTIRAKGALSISINFDKFFLPEGTEMYVYNENGNMITGPVTEAENNVNGIWGSWAYKGEYVTIELKTPVKSKDKLILHSSNIAYGYKELYETKVGGFGASGACNINVVCALGSGWTAERNSVALVLNGAGTIQFSGSLIMNYCNRPFFLTADHCYSATPDPGAWRFTFQAWSANCTPSANSNGVTFNGSTLRARSAASDIRK